MTFEVTEDTMRAIRRFAETEGLSIDMAVNVLIRAARNLIDKQLPDPENAEQRSLFAQQVAQRVAAILHPTVESQTDAPNAGGGTYIDAAHKVLTKRGLKSPKRP